ncbi:MAG: polysaccharide deacetylase family protein, partial [Candidatus Zixiibacteriota bacterium]
MSSDQVVGQTLPSVCHRPRILTFHKIMAGFTIESTNYSPRRFRSLLTGLANRGFRFCSVEYAMTHPDASAVALTFDDGYQHQSEVLMRLAQEHGIQPLVFVPTACVGKSNSWDYSHFFRPARHLDVQTIKLLHSLGVKFGSHGHRHINLCRYEYRDIVGELRQSK